MVWYRGFVDSPAQVLQHLLQGGISRHCHALLDTQCVIFWQKVDVNICLPGKAGGGAVRPAGVDDHHAALVPEQVLGGLAGVGQSLGRKARPGGHRRFGGAVCSRCRGGKRQPGQGHPEQAEGDGKGAQGVKQAENYFPHGENHSFPAGLSSGSMRKNAAPETEAHNFHTGMLYFTGGSVLY